VTNTIKKSLSHLYDKTYEKKIAQVKEADQEYQTLRTERISLCEKLHTMLDDEGINVLSQLMTHVMEMHDIETRAAFDVGTDAMMILSKSDDQPNLIKSYIEKLADESQNNDEVNDSLDEIISNIIEHISSELMYQFEYASLAQQRTALTQALMDATPDNFNLIDEYGSVFYQITTLEIKGVIFYTLKNTIGLLRCLNLL